MPNCFGTRGGSGQQTRARFCAIVFVRMFPVPGAGNAARASQHCTTSLSDKHAWCTPDFGHESGGAATESLCMRGCCKLRVACAMQEAAGVVPRQAVARHFHLPAAVLLGAGGTRLEGWQPPPQCSQRRATQVRGIHGMSCMCWRTTTPHAACMCRQCTCNMHRQQTTSHPPSSILAHNYINR